MSKPKCETCRYYDDRVGECRINPPTIIPGHPDGIWPIVETDGWCGEHEEPLELPVVNPQFWDRNILTPRDVEEFNRRREAATQSRPYYGPTLGGSPGPDQTDPHQGQETTEKP